ncbi:MAG: hypothetical protein WDM96_07755 [Lacunisphaera sp.]
MKPCVIATRQSPLALVQSRLVATRLRDALGVKCELLKVVTTGDRQADWNLEQKGGKGLFTGELEQHLLRGGADLAVHSTKDLPGDLPAGLVVVGYLPRADVRDVLVTRRGVTAPRTVATSSPRRRLQLMRLFPAADFTVIRATSTPACAKSPPATPKRPSWQPPAWPGWASTPGRGWISAG